MHPHSPNSTEPASLVEQRRRRQREARSRRAATAVASAASVVGGLATVRYGVGEDALRHVARPLAFGMLLGTAAAVGLGLRASAVARRLRAAGGRFVFAEFLLVLATCLSAGGAVFLVAAALTLPSGRDRASVAVAMFAAGGLGRFVGRRLVGPASAAGAGP